jgi:hypothetical protein
MQRAQPKQENIHMIVICGQDLGIASHAKSGEKPHAYKCNRVAPAHHEQLQPATCEADRFWFCCFYNAGDQMYWLPGELPLPEHGAQATNSWSYLLTTIPNRRH